MTTRDFPLLSLDAIKQAIDGPALSRIDEFLLRDQVGSTNDELWQRFSNGKRTPAVCLAETQTAGRGRRGDNWQSPACGNLYLSLFWPHVVDTPRHGLSIAIGISLIHSLERAGIKDLQLKWPNDVLSSRRKLAGILVESRFNSRQFTVVGVGLNFRLPADSRIQIQQPATSLEQLSETLPCRNWLAGKIIQDMIETTELFEHRGLRDFLPFWPRYDALHEQDISLIDGNRHIRARACGISESGELRYRHDNALHLLSSGQVSVRFAS